MSGMSIWEILLLGVGLSMDAFAVSICKGLSVKKVKWQHLLCVGAYFGIFQALMPTLGYFLGTTFSNLIDQFDHWVAFILLAIIGVNMVREALSKDEDETNDDFGFKTMLLLAIATSIDALAVGVTFALEGTDIALAACLIGLTTFTLSPIGLLVGHRFGLRYKSKAELVGGLVLIGIGLKILLEGLGCLGKILHLSRWMREVLFCVIAAASADSPECPCVLLNHHLFFSGSSITSPTLSSISRSIMFSCKFHSVNSSRIRFLCAGVS